MFRFHLVQKMLPFASLLHDDFNFLMYRYLIKATPASALHVADFLGSVGVPHLTRLVCWNYNICTFICP